MISCLSVKESLKGQKVIEEYDKHHTMSSESRQTLVKIAVAQLVEEWGPLVEQLLLFFVIANLHLLVSHILLK
jgi:hypothetical protein